MLRILITHYIKAVECLTLTVIAFLRNGLFDRVKIFAKFPIGQGNIGKINYLDCIYFFGGMNDLLLLQVDEIDVSISSGN